MLLDFLKEPYAKIGMPTDVSFVLNSNIKRSTRGFQRPWILSQEHLCRCPIPQASSGAVVKLGNDSPQC